MIFLAREGPMLGMASSSFWLAVFKDMGILSVTLYGAGIDFTEYRNEEECSMSKLTYFVDLHMNHISGAIFVKITNIIITA